MNAAEHVTDDIPAYALDSLSADRSVQVAQHLAGCKQCQDDLRAYEQVLTHLDAAIPARQPPARVLQGLLRRIERPHAEESRGRGLSGQLGFLLVASLFSGFLILALALTGFLFGLRGSLRGQQRQVVELTHSESAPGASGLVVISNDGDHGTLVVENMPALQEGMQYQLWLSKGAGLIPGQVFNVTETGYWGGAVRAVDPLASYAWFGVTMEPAEGSALPTGEILLAGDAGSR